MPANFDYDELDLFSLPLEFLNLSIRSYNALMRAKIQTIGNLMDESKNGLYRIRNLGRKSISEIDAIVSQLINNDYSSLNIEGYFNNDTSSSDGASLILSMLNFFETHNPKDFDLESFDLKQKFYDEYLNQFPFMSSHAISNEIFQTFFDIYMNQKQEILSLSKNDPGSLIKYLQNKLSFIEWNITCASISPDNYDLFLDNFISEEIKNSNVSIELRQVKDLVKLNESLNDFEDPHLKFKLNHLAKKLTTSIKKSIQKDLNKIYFTDREEIILNERIINKTSTLSTLGENLGITRERIRQIEQKLLRKISKIKFSYLNYFTTRELIKMMTPWTHLVTIENIMTNLADSSELFVIHLKKLKDFTYYQEYGLFTFSNDDWVIEYKKILSDYDEVLEGSELLDYFKKNLPFYFKDCPLYVDEILLQMLKVDLNVTVGKYSNKKISLGKMSTLVVENYFPEGLKIFDDDEYNKFRQILVNEYGFQASSSTKRALIARATSVLVLAGKKLYQIDEKVPKLSNDLFIEISEYIKTSKQSKFFYTTLFETFKERLLQEGINNRYLFQSRFKGFGDNDFDYIKDYVINKALKKTDIIAKTINPEINFFKFDDLKQDLPGYTDVMISMWVSQSKNYSQFYGQRIVKNTYINSFEREKLLMKQELERLLLNQDILSTHYLFKTYQSDLQNVFINLGVTGAFDLQQILMVWFSDWLHFKRPLVSNKPINLTNVTDFLNYYTKEKDIVYISELKEDLTQTQFKINNFLNLILQYESKFYWMNENELFRKEYLDLKEDFIVELRNELMKFFERTEVIDLTDEAIHNKMPIAGFNWNQYSISSLIRQHVPHIRILNSTGMYHNTKFFAVLSNSPIRNYQDYLNTKTKFLDL